VGRREGSLVKSAVALVTAWFSAALTPAFRASRPALARPERSVSESDGQGAASAARVAPRGRLDTVQKVLTAGWKPLETAEPRLDRPGRAPDSLVMSRLMPPPQGRSRSVRSSDTRACAGVRLVSSRGGALRHTREGDEKDVRDRAAVKDVIHFARSLDERLPRAVRGDLALGADR